MDELTWLGLNIAAWNGRSFSIVYGFGGFTIAVLPQPTALNQPQPAILR